MDYGWRFKVIFNRKGHGGFRRGKFQNRERTGVPKRAARLGWWMRPDHLSFEITTVPTLVEQNQLFA